MLPVQNKVSLDVLQIHVWLHIQNLSFTVPSNASDSLYVPPEASR